MKKLIGKVVGVIDQRSVKLEIATTKRHPMYKKRFTTTKNFIVDFRDLDLQVGDYVVFADCSPVSRLKRHRVLEKLAKKEQQ
ncbi:mitochondrial small ribosomal subunit protein uS17m [Candidatus Saccharibacteria bacterium]|nr:mitochondrial small ribosomal subunit protein uS17m [Candidatus Saccharibacteria bacterium]